MRCPQCKDGDLKPMTKLNPFQENRYKCTNCDWVVTKSELDMIRSKAGLLGIDELE